MNLSFVLIVNVRNLWREINEWIFLCVNNLTGTNPKAFRQSNRTSSVNEFDNDGTDRLSFTQQWRSVKGSSRPNHFKVLSVGSTLNQQLDVFSSVASTIKITRPPSSSIITFPLFVLPVAVQPEKFASHFFIFALSRTVLLTFSRLSLTRNS